MIAIEELEKDAIPEAVAAVLACRVFLNTATAEALQVYLNNTTINWTLFYEVIRAHHIRPVINNVVTNLKINEAFTNRLQADCKMLALKNFEHYRELLRLNSLFRAANILAVPYKGCIFSLQFYNDITLREFSDLDFLIHTGMQDVRAIREIMENEGYTTQFDAPGEFEEFHFSHKREFRFMFYVNGQRKFLAEFHSSLSDPVFETTAPVPNVYLFTDLKDEVINGNKIQLLSPEKHIIAILTHHGLREQWTSLKDITDLAIALKNKEIDWELIKKNSDAHRYNKVLAVGFNIAEDVLGVKRDGWNVQMVKIDPWLEKLFSRHLYKTDRTWQYNFRLKLRSKDSAADRYRMIWRHLRYLATPSILDYRFIKLPKALFFLYVFIKPVRMMWRGKSAGKAN